MKRVNQTTVHGITESDTTLATKQQQIFRGVCLQRVKVTFLNAYLLMGN